MTFQTIGDLAQSFALRRQGVDLRQQVDRLTLELSSGRVADLGQHLAGNLLPLADVEHELVLLSAHRTAAREAATDTSIMQSALDRVQTATTDLATQAITLGTAGTTLQLSNVVVSANLTLGSVIGALNSDVSGRALFAGARTERAPLGSSETLLSTLRSTLIGAATRSEVQVRLDAFFDGMSGGFQTAIYQGGTTGISPYQLGSGESVALDIRADDPALRDALKHLALIAVSNDAGLPLTEADRLDLAAGAGVALIEHQDALTTLRANLGLAEARIDQSASRISAEISGFEIARSGLVSSDPFEAAVELEQVQFQLETLYTLTARTARLNLLNFLS